MTANLRRAADGGDLVRKVPCCKRSDVRFGVAGLVAASGNANAQPVAVGR
jgi:hypothetical protein